MGKSKEYNSVKKILLSCVNESELKNGLLVANQFGKKYGITESSEEYEQISTIIDMVRERNRRLNESKPSSTRSEFKIAAGQTGVKDLMNLKFESEEELSKKHEVSIDDIKKEIEVGTDIEKEHKDTLEYIKNNPDASLEDVARKIAMDHIREKCDYYTNPEDGVIAIEKNAEGGDEIEEATSAGSSGQYTGLFSGEKGGEDVIKRDIHKTPTASAGGMTNKINKPIGKINTLNVESKVFKKKDIVSEAGDYSAMVGQYDTPGWGNSSFMLTKPKKGKKGKARVRKGNDFKKTYDYDTGSSTFVKIKDKCKKFPYCNQSPEAIKTSKTPFKNESVDEGVKDMLPKKEKIKQSWQNLVSIARREGKETTIAAGILKKIITNKDVTDEEIKYLKSQSGDVLKLLAMASLGVTLSTLINKGLSKWGISLLPKDQGSLEKEDDDDDKEKIVENIARKTGKSKKYVHSLINRYL
jgi:hypothetical protein